MSEGMKKDTYILTDGTELVVATPPHGPAVAYAQDLGHEFNGPTQFYPVPELEGTDLGSESRFAGPLQMDIDPEDEEGDDGDMEYSEPEAVVVRDVKDQVLTALSPEDGARFLEEHGGVDEIVQLIGFRLWRGARVETRADLVDDDVLSGISTVAQYVTDEGKRYRDDLGEEAATDSMTDDMVMDSCTTGAMDSRISGLMDPVLDTEELPSPPS